jgi:hypothetical protein
MRIVSLVSGCSMVLAVASVGCKKKPAEDGQSGASSASASAASAPSAAPSSAASAVKEDPDACPKGNKPPEYVYADVKLTWSEKPSLADAPKEKSYANVGGKTFELPKVELWISEKQGDITLRTNDGVLLGPSLMFKGVPKAGFTVDEKFGQNRGYFQVPKKGVTVECSKQTTSYNGQNARIVKITKYDGKVADGSFVTTWQETSGEKRKFWAAGTFKDAKVVVFK